MLASPIAAWIPDGSSTSWVTPRSPTRSNTPRYRLSLLKTFGDNLPEGNRQCPLIGSRGTVSIFQCCY